MVPGVCASLEVGTRWWLPPQAVPLGRRDVAPQLGPVVLAPKNESAIKDCDLACLARM